MQQLSGSCGRTSAQPCFSRATAGAISPEPKNSFGLGEGVLAISGRSRVALEGVVEGLEDLGDVGGVAEGGRGDDRRSE